jgi:uncharacterized protein (TIGR02597 family)
LLSIPLFGEAAITGRGQGKISSAGPSTITSVGAGWREGELSQQDAPFFIEITSGAAAGMVFLISTATANTSDTLTIAPSEAASVDLTKIGINTSGTGGDSYKIWAADTLGGFFGAPTPGGIQGGATAREADTVILVSNGSASTYFYNTAITPPGWVKVSVGMPRADHVPIPPYSGVQYSRISSSPMEIVATGAVPAGIRQVAIKNSGATILAPHWPLPQTLASLRLQDIPGWRRGNSAREADTVVMVNAGAAATFFHNGTHWRRVAPGNQIADGTAVPVGASLLINRKGVDGGYSVYSHQAPYRLD